MKNIKLLDKQFSLLCWNIQKRSLLTKFEHTFHHLLNEYPTQIIAFQEVKLAGKLPKYLQNYVYAICTNISTLNNIYGVMTLSDHHIQSAAKMLSKAKEFGMATRKGTLLTTHPIVNGSSLNLLNVHAINFVSFSSFAKEIDRISNIITDCGDGPMIVTGDFNTWSKKRQLYLRKVLQNLKLHKAAVQNRRMIKMVMKQPLDHIYYKNLKLQKALAIDTPISDHNPLYAIFQCDER